VTHLKCPDCGITLIDRSGLEAKPCPRCLLRSGAVVQMLQGMQAQTMRVAPDSEIRHA
jgi:Zn-finger nucleic acid-binding protein